MKKALLVLLFTIQAFGIASQENYKFRTLSPEGGFYFDGIKQIQQDADGFVWIIMDHDLYRFDGYQYKRYYTYFNNLDNSVEWVFNSLITNSSGYFFVGTNNGLYSYNKVSDTFSKVTDNADAVRIDNLDNIWFRKDRTWHMINRDWNPLNTSDSLVIAPTYDGQKPPFISSVFCTNNNDLYTFSNYTRIYSYNYVKREFSLCFNMPEKDGQIIGAKAYKGKLWVLVAKYGLYKIDLSTFTIEEKFDFFHENEVRAFYVDKRGYIWIGTIKGLYVMNPETKKHYHYVHSESDPYSLPNNSVWTINEDNQKNIWIGTYSGAVCYVNLNEELPFKNYMPQEGSLSHIPVSAFAEDKSSIWIGTEGGGIDRLNKLTGEFTYYKSSQSANSPAVGNVKSIVVDKNEDLWIGMYNGGLDYYNTKTNRFVNFKSKRNENSLLDNRLRKIVLEADSGLWIAYQRRWLGVSFYSFKTKQFSHHRFDETTEGKDTLIVSYTAASNTVNKVDRYVFDIQRGRENQLWVVSNESLYLMDVVRNTVKEIKGKDSTFMNFSTLCIDDSGNLWIGTIKNGLIKYNPDADEFTFFKNILNHNISSIYSINYDGEGCLWMGTDNGLIRYNIADNTFYKYDKEDGVQGQVYYPLASMKGVNGELYFGGTNGFTQINPKKVRVNTYQSNVIISDFYIDLQPSKLNLSSNEIVLKYNQTNFGFKFSSDNYLITEKNHFKYRLKGYDDRWIEVDASSRTALYSKVPPGTYYFEVLATNNDGVWSDTPTVIKIIRKPAPWFSWPAYILYFIIVAGILFMIFRYYTEKKKLKLQLYLDNIEKDKKEQIHQSQLRFFTNISHDFRTPLSLIMAALDRLRQEGLKEYYYRILNSNTQRLLNLVNELMDFRTVENGKMKLGIQPVDLNLFIEGVASDFLDYAKQRNINFKVITDSSFSSPVFVDKHVVEKIVMNLLNNAFKYTKEGGTISIETLINKSAFVSKYDNNYTVTGEQYPSNTFSIVVRDNGVGISKESIANVFERFYKVNTVNADSHLGTGIGLALVKSLVLLHKGTITIYSERDKGTDMLVCLPLDKSCYKETDFLVDEIEKENIQIIRAEEEDIEEVLEETVLLRDKKRILLAEDNIDLRSLIAGSLSDDYEIIEADNGLVASKFIESMDIDLIISDIMMPVKDGITLCSEAKNDINTSHIPFILLTAKTSLESKIEGVDSGADMYFEKPVDLNFLKLSIQNIFKHQQQLKEYYAKNYYVDSAELSSNEHDNKFLKKFIEIIDANLDQSEMDVNYIASELSMSRSKLYTKIKSLTDKSIIEFIVSYRMRKAARLIIEKDMTMREIMALIGIESQPYFTNAFKKEFGETPTAFAAKHKKGGQK